MFKSLKTNTNRMTNEENGARNDIGIDHDRDSTMLQPCFLFFLLLLSYFYQFLHYSMLEPLLSLPSMPIYRKMGTWGNGSSPRRAGACPGEPMLTPEVTGSLRRAGSLTLK